MPNSKKIPILVTNIKKMFHSWTCVTKFKKVPKIPKNIADIK